MQRHKHEWRGIWIAYEDPDNGNVALVQPEGQKDTDTARGKYEKVIVTLRQCITCNKYTFYAPRKRLGSTKPISILKFRQALQYLEPRNYGKTELIEQIRERISSDFRTVEAVIELYYIVEKDQGTAALISKVVIGEESFYHVNPPTGLAMSSFIYRGREPKDWMDGFIISHYKDACAQSTQGDDD